MLLNRKEKKILEILKYQYLRGGVESAEAEEIVKLIVSNDINDLNTILEIWDNGKDVE